MVLIDQQEALDALNTQAEEMSHWHEGYAEQRKGILTAVRIVSDIKPKHGKWKPRYYYVGADVYVEWACSECGYVRQKGMEDGNAGEEPEADFCEKCGAKMER